MKCTILAEIAPSKNRTSVVAAASMVAGILAAAGLPARADTAYAFGLNQYGQIGDGQSGNGGAGNSPPAPVPVNVLDNSVTAFAVGGADSLFVDNGALYGVGLGAYGELGYGGTNLTNTAPLAAMVLTSGVTAVKGGLYFSIALANGGVYTYGNNIDAALGNGTSSGETNVPTLTSNPILNSGVTAIAAGQAHGLALQSGGIFAWGLNSAGQIGNGTYSPSVYVTTPIAVPGMSSGVTSISAGYEHSLAVMNGAAYAWGFNDYGQLGLGNSANTGQSLSAVYPSPTPVVGLPSGVPVSTVGAGTNYSLALVQGVPYAWGRNEAGELGNGTTSGANDANQVPTPVSGITSFITAVQAGNNTGYALGADGTVWSWGSNTYGQIGNNTSTGSYNMPQQLFAPGGYVFTGIAAGSNASHVVVTIGVAPSSWVPDADCNWNDSGNWTGGVPNSVDAAVTFTAPPITATRTITTSTPITVANLTFTSAYSYIIQGSGSITVRANLASSVRGAAINDYVGNHTVAPATLEFATNTNLEVIYGSTLTLGSPAGSVIINSNTSVSEIDYGTVSFTSLVTLQSDASLNLATPTSINALSLAASATTTVAAHAFFSDNVLTLGGLSLNSTATLDLTNNESIIHNGNLAAITTALSTGCNGGAWNGSGIVSSTAASDTTHLTAIGSLLATGAMNVSGQSLVAGDVLLKYTYYGDADLSGSVDGSDYSRIDNGYLMQLTGWNNGDFNYDGVVDGSDYTLIDNTFNTQGAAINSEVAAPTAQIGGATSSVPEPTSLALLGIGATSLLARRRRLR